MTTIDNLVDDVLRAILDYIVLTSRPHSARPDSLAPKDSLKNVARVCRRWRAMCLPIIFRDAYHKPLRMTRHGVENVQMLPPSIYLHIRVLHLDLWIPGRLSLFRSMLPPRTITDACDNTLPPFSCLPNVHTVIFNNSPVGIWPTLLDKVVQGPSLKALEWRNSPWRSSPIHSLEHNPLSSITHYPPLRRISYEVQKPYPVLHRANLDTSSEEATLYTIFEQVSAHVEHLALPGEAANFGRMAELNWSSLRELILVGRAPVHDRPLIALLVHLVGLRLLDLQISFTPDFFVWPPDFELCSTNANARRGLLPVLENLSLTNADTTDLILRHIPSNVTTLSLVPHPRSFITRYDGVLISALSPTVAMKADEIITILANNDVTSLTTLRVSVYGVLASRLFRTISDACPLLETLEVFHRRSASLEQVDESCLDIGSALCSLDRLRTLRIAFDFTDAPDKRSRFVSYDEFDFRPFWETCLQRATNIAMRAGPSLQQLSFSKRRAEKGFWFNYDIERSPTGQFLKVVEREDDCEYT